MRRTLTAVPAAALACMLLAACPNQNFDAVMRTYSDPFDDTPTAESYLDMYAVRLGWQEDDAADEFILCRAPDDGGYGFEAVYRGTGTCYTDRFSESEEGERYIYRLDKRRGERVFTGSGYALAVSCMAVDDRYEENDTEDRATWLDVDIDAVMPCCRYVHGDTTAYDPDWYYVTLMPHRRAYVVLEQTGYGSDTAVLSTDDETDFIYMTEAGKWEPVRNKTAFVVDNPTHGLKDVKFKIYPDTAKVIPTSPGFAVLAYRLSLREVVP